jgi:hypothetical protein
MARPRKVTPDDAKTDGMIRCVVLRDYWAEPEDDGAEVRVRAGTMIEVSAEEALDGIESGTLSRVKTDANP